MTIKTKLIAGTLVAALLVVGVSVLMVRSSGRVISASKDMQRATEIVNTVSQIRFSTFENLLHHDKRSLAQWRLKHDQLPALLQPEADASTEERAALATISKLSKEEEVIFERLVQSYATTDADAASQQELQERLASQLLIKQQTQITLALSIADAAHAEVVRSNAGAGFWAFGSTLFMLLAIANLIFFSSAVSTSLRALQKGAEAIAGGRFGYRITPRNHGDEFGQVARAFNNMAAATGQIDKIKSEFILLASHQLRTPLTAVKWYAKALTTPGKKLAPTTQAQYLQQIYDSNERMIELVNKLLSATAVETGQLAAHVEPVVLKDTLKAVLSDLTAQIHENDIHVVQDVETNVPPVAIDPTWMYAILQGIVSNAVRYSRRGHPVVVEAKQTGQMVIISVTDQGYGIPVDQRSKIFTKLFRADNATKIIGEGSGLDLYIAKMLLEKAHGSIRFTSVENKGTVFYVEVPVWDEAAHANQKSAGAQDEAVDDRTARPPA